MFNKFENLRCFNNYDIRGIIGDELTEDIAYRIGLAVAAELNAKSIVVGYDARESSPIFAASVSSAICDSGANVIDIGLAGTEEMYWAVTHFSSCGGIEVTASHNPINYNGMKIVKSNSEPLSKPQLMSIKSYAENGKFQAVNIIGEIQQKKDEAREAYIEKILSFVDTDRLKPLRIVVNGGNGALGPTFDRLTESLSSRGVKTNFEYLNHEPDSSFPNGIPNPLLPEKRAETANLVKETGADFGVAFDGDFDRCFLFDENGFYVDNEYVIALIAAAFCSSEPGSKIIHDAKVIWNIRETVSTSGGKPIISRTGHSFMKHSMRSYDAIYGGELSAHHYFRDFSYCDSGIIPFLLIWQILSSSDKPLSTLILEKQKMYKSSGEINFAVKNIQKCISDVELLYGHKAELVDRTDGLSMEFKNWRFNIRSSNTENLVRLNIEAISASDLIQIKLNEFKKLIETQNLQ